MASQYSCDYCNNLVFDDELEEYVCDVNMDEDDYARLLNSKYKQCPYYQSNDEYKVVRHQMQYLLQQVLPSVKLIAEGNSNA